MRPVIIGNSTAAIAAVEAIHQYAPGVSPVLIAEEALPPYSPTALIALAEGRIQEKEFFFRDSGVYRRNHVEEKLGKRAIRIDPRERFVILENGEQIPFSTLLIAAGARPKKPGAPGLADGEAITLRSIKDARQLESRLKNSKEACIVGAGLIGMELAQALLAKGMAAKVVEILPQIIPASFDRQAALVIQRVFEERGVRFFLNASDLSFQSGKQPGVKQVSVSGTAVGNADLILWTTGISPRIDLVEGTLIRVNRGIWVNQKMETSVAGIYAAGDIAEAPDFFSGEPVMNPILPAAAAQGRVAGMNMIGQEAEFPGNLKMNIFSYFGRVAFSVGEIVPSMGDEEIVIRHTAQEYGKIMLRAGKLTGGVFVNMDFEPGIFRAMVASREDFSSSKRRFMEDIKSFSRVWMMRRRTEGVSPREGFSRAGRRVPGNDAGVAQAAFPICQERKA